MIKDYAELTDSSELQTAYIQLARMAGIEEQMENVVTQKVVNMPNVENQSIPTLNEMSSQQSYAAASGGGSGINTISQPVEMITYKGKSYPKYNDLGQKFRSLYRGQPSYS